MKINYTILKKNNMQNYHPRKSSLDIYPGHCVPKYTAEEMKVELRNANGLFLYTINMKELKDLYQLDIEIPGAKNEDFVLQIDDNILSVSMLHKVVEHFDGDNFSLKNLKSICVSKKIILPADADTIFIAAAYQAGVLHLVFPKTTEQNKNLHTDIVVY
jgi:HSP20 family molecular chaperone IbpA